MSTNYVSHECQLFRGKIRLSKVLRTLSNPTIPSLCIEQEMILNIREAYESESKVISELAFESKAYWGYSPEFMEACRVELSATPEKLSSELFIYNVYEIEKEVIGFYAIERLNDNEAELEALFVRPKFIGSGIGKALIKHALQYVKSSGYLSLKIQGDPNAEGFYLAAGAEHVGKQESVSIKGRYLPIYKHNLQNA